MLLNESNFATVELNQTPETMKTDTDYIKYEDVYDITSAIEFIEN